jgi:DNA-binding ferritin-like protein
VNHKQKMAIDLLQHLLGLMRAQYWMYQEMHWRTKGPAYYGNHLLFQRLYESMVEQTDVLAEKMVGTYGPDSVCSSAVAPKFEKFISRWGAVECFHRRGLLSEADCQKVLKTTYERLKAMGELSLGMDDFLMATASDHETNQYLLRQVLRSKEAAEK